ncbi:MAG: GyrI-like domain-containing protein [bacterium]|nr:GyrI-like domain-containing protein [bacterium]
MSLSDIQQETIEPFDALVLEQHAKMLAMPALMKQGFTQLKDALQDQELSASGFPFTVYLDLDWAALNQAGALKNLLQMVFKRWHYQLGFPVDGAKEQGVLKTASFAGGPALTAVHTGSYAMVGASYKELNRWAEDQGLTLAQQSFEFYLNDPKETPTDQLKTRLVLPLA